MLEASAEQTRPHLEGEPNESQDVASSSGYAPDTRVCARRQAEFLCRRETTVSN